MPKEKAIIDAQDRLRHKLKEARTSAGMTQYEVAERLARPQSFISKLETRERRVGFIELQMLAHIYGKPVKWFGDEGGFILGMAQLDRSGFEARAEAPVTA